MPLPSYTQDSLQMLWLATYLTGFPPAGLYALNWAHGLTPNFLLIFLWQPLKSFRRHLLLPLFLSVQAASPSRVRRLTDSLLNLLFLSRSPAYHTHLLCLFPCYKPLGRRTEAVPASGSSPQPDRRRLQALSPASSCPPYQMPDSSGSSQ